MNVLLRLLLLLTIPIACGIEEKKMGDFALLPSVHEFTVTGISNLRPSEITYCFSPGGHALPPMDGILATMKGTDSPKNAQLIFDIDSLLDISSEGYVLNIQEERIQLSGKDEAGLFYGFKTLAQLMQDAKEQEVYLPLCSIRDYPLLPYRAIHLDVKHHLDKMEYYYRLIDKLASYKINGIIIEFEDKIQFKRRPGLASADAFSITDWRRLSDYAKDRHVEISPLTQGLGHSSFVLKHKAYAHLRDDPKSDWAYNPLDPETYEVQFDLYRDAMEATPYGRYLHVGGDEVHTTGRGSDQSALALQLTWLNKVCRFAEEKGRIPIFWDDMPLKDAGVWASMFNTELSQEEVDTLWTQNEHKLLKFLNQFPKNCVYMRWNYQAPHALGNEKAMEWFRSHGLETMGATAGQTRWVLMPQNESNIDNIKAFALSSIKNGLNGLLLTLWDDDSPHFELYMRGMLAFAEYTWAGEKRSKKELKSAYRNRQYGYETAADSLAFIDQLEGPVGYWKNLLLKKPGRNLLRREENPMEEVIDLPQADHPGEWSKKYRERLDEAKTTLARTDSVAATLTRLKTLARNNTYNLGIYEQVTHLVRFSNEALLKLKSYDEAPNESARKKALEELDQLSKRFTELRKEMESIYGKTRILHKPEDYILDQDHHSHLANQSLSFDWQFGAELLFLEKLEQSLLKELRHIKP
ncbi:MAG: glycoside hydrolase family 20 zincin-like fold domain-containing protein [Bacteroidota bacterium]